MRNAAIDTKVSAEARRILMVMPRRRRADLPEITRAARWRREEGNMMSTPCFMRLASAVFLIDARLPAWDGLRPRAGVHGVLVAAVGVHDVDRARPEVAVDDSDVGDLAAVG